MAWSASKIFMAFPTDAFNSTATMNIDANTIKAALFDNSITPSQTVASASSAYAAGVWASGGVVDTGTSAPAGWPAAGIALGSVTSTFSSNTYTFDAADSVSANSATTLAGTYGTLIYDDTLTTPVADQGLCYSYFGGSQSVTLGTFTIVWNASGIMQLTL